MVDTALVDQDAVPNNEELTDAAVIEPPTLKFPFDGFTEIIDVEPPAMDNSDGEVALELSANTILYKALSFAGTTDTAEAVMFILVGAQDAVVANEALIDCNATDEVPCTEAVMLLDQ